MYPYMLIIHKDHKNTIQIYSVTVMTHVISLDARQSKLQDRSLLDYVMFYRVVIFLGRFLAPIFNHI